MAGFSACSNEDVLPLGEGRVLLSAKVNSDVKVASRADLDQSKEELAEKCQVWISNEKGLVYRYQGLDNVPTDGITLLSGHYIAEAWTGDSVPASFEHSWFKGRKEFDITANEVTRVDLTCKIANTLVTVEFGEGVADVLSDYTMTVSHSRGFLVWEENEDRTGYFMMPSTDTDLAWKLQGNLRDGSLFTKEGTIQDVKQAYKYNLKITCQTQEEEFGGAYFKVEVDPTAVETEEVIDITIAPEIQGYGFDLSETTLGEMGALPRRSVIVKSATEITNILVECDDFDDILGLGGNDVDLIDMKVSVAQLLADGGVSFSDISTANDGTSMYKITFEPTFVNKFQNGLHDIKITATDKNGRYSTATIHYNVSDADAMADDTQTEEVWAYKAVLRGTVTKDGAENVAFRYRPYGTEDWTTVDAVADSRAAFGKGAKVKAELSELQPATQYEWQMTVDEFDTATKYFTTGSAEQLPNASFENWSGSLPLLIYGSGESMFWDSGNHGSASMGSLGGVNITSYVTSPVHHGQRSISLSSKNVVIKFAAGNVFIGEYLKTDGTDGVLGWGRPFTGRPKELKVWAHYTQGTIDKYQSGAPADLSNGGPDKGIIYCALLDDQMESSTVSGVTKKYPVVIQTNSKSRMLFEPDGKHKDRVIAYGVHEFTESTEGDDLVEITIPLDYRTLDKLPSNIILTASASKGGDYFTGSTQSVLILDDIQLIYE